MKTKGQREEDKINGTFEKKKEKRKRKGPYEEKKKEGEKRNGPCEKKKKEMDQMKKN